MLQFGSVSGFKAAPADEYGRGSNQPIGVADAIAFVRRRTGELTASVLISLLLVGLYIYTAPDYFTATSRILIDTKRTAQLEANGRDKVFDDANAQSQVEVVSSANVLLPVIRNLGLATDAEFLNPPRDIFSYALQAALQTVKAAVGPLLTSSNRNDSKADEKTARALDMLVGNLDVRRAGTTFVLNVSYRALQPERAAEIVNAIADSYVKEEIRAKFDAAEWTGTWMQERLADLREQANAAARAVQEFKTNNNIVDTGRGLVGEQQLAEVTTQLVLARTQTNEAKARLDRVKEIFRTGTLDATVTDTLRIDVVNKLRQQLLDASMKESDISARFGSSHQVAIRARDEVAQLRRSLQSELHRIAETFTSDYEIAKSREDALEKSMAELIRAQAGTNEARARLRELESTALTYTALFESALKRQTEVSQQQSFPLAEARIITRGTPPLSKSHPRTMLLIVTALLGGGIMGLGLALIRDTLDPVFRTPESLENFMGLRCIATVPRIPSSFNRRRATRLPLTDGHDILAPGPLSYALAAPLSAFAEGIRSMKVAIDLVQEGRGPLIVGITSAAPNEGKSTLASNLAQLIAWSGQTCLLIDADLRNPTLTRSAVPDAVTGLGEVLTGDVKLEDVLHERCEGALAFVPSRVAKSALDTSSLLCSSRMKHLLENEAGRFDYVLIDLPPMAPLVDVRAISPLLDKLLVIVEWAVTDREVLKQALERNGPEREDQILGLVLNKIPGRVLKQYATYRFDTYLRGV